MFSTTYTTNSELLNAFSSNKILLLDNNTVTGVRFGNISTGDWELGNISSGSIKLELSDDNSKIHITQNDATIDIDGKNVTNLDAFITRTDEVHN
jgi:hypothetical protein